MTENFEHVPVLLEEVIEGLNIQQNGIYVDGTLGGAGHSKEILQRIPEGRLIGIDQDEDALEAAEIELSKVGKNFTLVHDNFSNIKVILEKLQIEKVDGILIDIGVSSYQLDTPERGFSYRYDGPLDMRMNQFSIFTAKDVVNKYSEDELRKIFYMYGEEKWSARIAKFIVAAREESPIETTGQLVEIIKNAIPAKARAEGSHPAKKVFQALRIEVNEELHVLEKSVPEMVEVLKPGGRLAVITFHSLEDRIVKELFRDLEKDCICPPEFPVCTCDKKQEIKIITKKPVIPTEEEQKLNHRSHSAKLRIAEKII